MSLRNAIPELEYDTPYGLDTTTPVAAVKPGYVREAYNFDIGFSGGYTKRKGYESQLDVDYGSRTVTFGVQFRTSFDLDRVVIFATDGSASGGQYGWNDSGTITDISTSLSGTARPVLIQFGDLLFFYNGDDAPEVYDGTSVRQVGITAPLAAPAIAGQAATGDLTQLASYVFAYTYYNSVTGAESSPSPFTDPETLTGANNQINLTLVAGDSQTADTIRVYRTYGDSPGPLFLDGETTVGSTSYASTVEDAGLGRQLELDNSRIDDLTSEAKYATAIENRIFVKTGNNEIRWSKIGQEGPMPESFEVKSVTKTNSKFGAANDILGINRISTLPVVLKSRGAGRLDPVGIPDNGISADNVLFQYREMSDSCTAVSHWAAVQVFDELIFLGRDNIYATDGVKVRPVADFIKATIKTLGFISTQVDRLSAENDAENSRVYFSVFSSFGATDPDMVIVGDYQLYPHFRWTFYSQGTDVVTWPGISADCFFKVTNDSGKDDIWFGNAVANGKVYKMNTGFSDDGDAIWGRLVTRPYSGNNPLMDKLFKLSEVHAKGDGNDYDLTVCSIYDLSGVEEECIPLSLSSEGFLYDDVTSLYDSATYSDDSVKDLDYNMHRRAQFMQLVFKQTDADAPVDIFGWGVASSGIGLRGQ